MAKNKTRNVNAISKPELEEELPIEQVWDVLAFANTMTKMGMFPGIMTPDLINQKLKDISFNPIGATEDALNKALSSPKSSEAELRSFVENMELVSAPFRRILAYMASHLAFDLTYSVKNIKKPEEYTSTSFKKDQRIAFEFLDKFDYIPQFTNVVKQLLRNEMYVCSPREEGEKIVLQELPLDRCKITAKWDYGFLVSFDFAYFLQPGVDIRLYPKFFQKRFNQIWGTDSMGKKVYNPNIAVEARGNSQWVYWVDLPPEIGWVFKFDPSLVTSVPYYASLIPDLMNQPLIRNLQKNMNIAAASKILIGEVPFLKESKSNVADMVAMKPETLGKFLALVKSALADTIKVTAAPLNNMSSISFDADPTMYDEYLRTATSASGVNAPLIYSGKLKANAIESQLSFQSDSLIMQALYPQFDNFLNYYIGRDTKTYKFDFAFEGNSYYLDRQNRFDYSMDMFDRGILLPQKIAAARGIKPHTFMRMIEESNAMGFADMLRNPDFIQQEKMAKLQQEQAIELTDETQEDTLEVTKLNQEAQEKAAKIQAKENKANGIKRPKTPATPAKKGTKGRPRAKDSELSDSGSQTREDGGNLPRGGKV